MTTEKSWKNTGLLCLWEHKPHWAPLVSFWLSLHGFFNLRRSDATFKNTKSVGVFKLSFIVSRMLNVQQLVSKLPKTWHDNDASNTLCSKVHLIYLMLLQNSASISCVPVLLLTDTNSFVLFVSAIVCKYIYKFDQSQSYVNMLHSLTLNQKCCCQNISVFVSVILIMAEELHLLLEPQQ